MMPNTHMPYVMPRPMRKFKVWPQPVQDKALLILNEKISPTDKIQVVVDVLSSDCVENSHVLDSKQVSIVNEMAIEVEMPKMSYGTSVKIKLEISKTSLICWN